MHRALTILGLIAFAAALPLPAQEVPPEGVERNIFEVPVDLDLPATPVVLDLDNASLEVVLDAAAPSVLRVRGPLEKDASGTALAVDSEGGTIVVRRAGAPVGAHGGAPRLRLELVLGPERWLQVFGSDLDVVLEAVPVAETGEEDDDEDVEDESDDDDEDDEDEDEEDEGDEEDDDEGDEDGVGASSAGSPVATAPDHNLSLEVAGSSVNLIGVQNAQVTATGSYLHAAGTRGKLTLALEGVTAELKGHLGALDLTARDSEVTLAEMQGRVAPAVSGGSLLVRGGVGQVAGRFDGALLRIDGWRGPIAVDGSGAIVEARAILGTRMEIRGDGHVVRVDELQGLLLANLAGGGLTAGKLRGQAKITARAGADVAIDGLEGQPTLILENSAARVSGVVGQLTADLRGGRLEVDGVRQLDLVATGSEIVAGRIEHLGKVEVTDSQLDLDLWQLKNNPALTLEGTTEARVRLRTPCSVKLGEVQLLGGGTDVTGCDLHSQTLRRTRHDRQGLDGQRRVLLSATLGEGSSLEVEGVP